MNGRQLSDASLMRNWPVCLNCAEDTVGDLEEAMYRIKNYVAPANAIRLDGKTPCVKTSRCEECSSPERICNTWAITEKSWPKGRVKVVVINEDLGL